MTRSFAAALDDLCGRRKIANTDLAKAVAALGGDMTNSYISHLRKGLRDNPTLQTIEYLAAALDVCPAAFVGGRAERLGEEWPRRSFPARLRRLFDKVYPVSRGPFTPEEVARAVSERGTYGSISSSYLRELLNPAPDTLPNPRLKHLLGLADHFGLADDNGPQATYFLDDRVAATFDAELDDFIALREAGVVELVTRVAERAPHWSPEMRRQAVSAFTQAVESGETNWVYPAPDGES
jgi:transcriptional regulator with XRE-family HTH domain